MSADNSERLDEAIDEGLIDVPGVGIVGHAGSAEQIRATCGCTLTIKTGERRYCEKHQRQD